MIKFKITQKIGAEQIVKEIQMEFDELIEILNKDFSIIKAEIISDYKLESHQSDLINHLTNENSFFHYIDKDKSGHLQLSTYYEISEGENVVKKGFMRIIKHFYDKEEDGEKYKLTNLEKVLLFSYSCKYDNLEVAKWLVEEKETSLDHEFDHEDHKGLSLLHLACKKNSVKIVEYLMQHDSDPNAMDSENMTPIFYAYKHPDLVIAKFMKENGALLTTKKSGNMNHFHYVCSKGYIEAAKWLDKQNAKIHAKAENGKTALHYACLGKHIEIARWLTDEKEFDSETTDIKGNTALHYASESSYDNFEISRWLVEEKNANINRINSSGESPLLLYSKANRFPFFKWLVEEKLDSFDPQYRNIDALVRYICKFDKFGRNEAALWLIDSKGADINSADEKGKTLLKIAIGNGNSDLTHSLLVRGANYYTLSYRSGEFPLHTEQEYCSDFYQKLLDYRTIERMPYILLKALPKEWFLPSKQIELLTHLVSSKGFVQITKDPSESSHFTSDYIDLGTGYHCDYDDRDDISHLKSFEEYFEIICTTNTRKIKDAACLNLLSIAWNVRNKESMSEIGPKIRQLYALKICKSKDILTVLEKPYENWIDSKTFCKSLFMHFISEGRTDEAIALLKFDKSNYPLKCNFMEEAMTELKVQNEEASIKIEEILSPSEVKIEADSVDLAGQSLEE